MDLLKSAVEFFLPPLLFAGLLTLVARHGRPAAIALAAGWVAVLGAWFVAAAPGPHVPLHDFEKTPVPAILATLAGAAAATAFFLSTSKKSLPGRVRFLATVGAYTAAAIPVYVVVLVLHMM